MVGISDVTTQDHSRFRKCKLPLPADVEDPLKLAPQAQTQPTTQQDPPPPPPPPATQ